MYIHGGPTQFTQFDKTEKLMDGVISHEHLPRAGLNKIEKSRSVPRRQMQVGHVRGNVPSLLQNKTNPGRTPCVSHVQTQPPMAAGAPLPLSLKIADSILLIFFLVISLVAPLFDAQTCFPSRFFPQFLVDLNSWYVNEYGDFLMLEKPGFLVGLIWLEIVFQWPLAIANIVGIIGRRSWYRTTCLIYGVSTSSSMVAILGELIGSGKATDKLLMVYSPFLVLSLLAILRGLVTCSSSSSSTHLRSGRKKRV